MIRLANFINKVVGQRKLPENIDEKILGKPSVVVKLDIEGTEVEVIQDLIMQGTIYDRVIYIFTKLLDPQGPLKSKFSDLEFRNEI